MLNELGLGLDVFFELVGYLLLGVVVDGMVLVFVVVLVLFMLLVEVMFVF